MRQFPPNVIPNDDFSRDKLLALVSIGAYCAACAERGICIHDEEALLDAYDCIAKHADEWFGLCHADLMELYISMIADGKVFNNRLEEIVEAIRHNQGKRNYGPE